jgi:hypothetical protein
VKRIELDAPSDRIVRMFTPSRTGSLRRKFVVTSIVCHNSPGCRTKYVKLELDETVVLQFNLRKIKHVEGQFGPTYTVQHDRPKLL